MTEFLNLTPDELAAKLGEPEATGGTSRKQKLPLLYKYGNIEYHFYVNKVSRERYCWMVFDNSTHKTLAISANV